MNAGLSRTEALLYLSREVGLDPLRQIEELNREGRERIGALRDEAFFALLREWTATYRHRTVTTSATRS